MFQSEVGKGTDVAVAMFRGGCALEDCKEKVLSVLDGEAFEEQPDVEMAMSTEAQTKGQEALAASSTASDGDNPNINDVVQSGDFTLVRDIVLADPKCVDSRTYDIILHARFSGFVFNVFTRIFVQGTNSSARCLC